MTKEELAHKIELLKEEADSREEWQISAMLFAIQMALNEEVIQSLIDWTDIWVRQFTGVIGPVLVTEIKQEDAERLTDGEGEDEGTKEYIQ